MKAREILQLHRAYATKLTPLLAGATPHYYVVARAPVDYGRLRSYYGHVHCGRIGHDRGGPISRASRSPIGRRGPPGEALSPPPDRAPARVACSAIMIDESGALARYAPTTASSRSVAHGKTASHKGARGLYVTGVTDGGHPWRPSQASATAQVERVTRGAWARALRARAATQQEEGRPCTRRRRP